MTDFIESETVFFKGKSITGKDVEILFHKDYTYFYNPEALPVVKYTLINCVDSAAKNFEDIDRYNDGICIQVRQNDALSVFEATDMGGRIFQIACLKIIKEDLEYRKQDYIDIINEFIKQSDNGNEVIKKYRGHLEMTKTFLRKEIDSIERRVDQAVWLNKDKRNMFGGELKAFRKALELISRIEDDK